MLEAKYYRDYGHNYMILQCRQRVESRSYQYKILTSGKIDNILVCSVRHINGITYYYYDISSRTTLENLYRGKKMSYAQVKDFLYQLHEIYEKLSAYFMDEAGLVLLPEHIYYNITDKKYIALYYPDYRAEENVYKPLMDFLLEHIDMEDRRLADYMYNIYELAETDYFVLEDALRILEDKVEPVQEATTESSREAIQEPVTSRMETFDAMEDLVVPQLNKKEAQKINLFYPVFAILSALGIAGAIVVQSIYELTEREEIVLYGVIAAMGVCLILCFVGIFADGRRRVKIGKKLNHFDTFDIFDRGADPEARGTLHEEIYERCGKESNTDYFTDMSLPPLEPTVDTDRKPAIQRNEDCSKTIFYDENSINEYKLYALDRKNKSHIELKQFPCTVGKLSGCVDYVLSDNSVSRIHARFDRQGDKILLTDMNSTNGTYKNGLRMQPQETVEIEPGDEVRFGNLNYCYR